MDRYIFYGVATNTNADGSVKDVTISQMDETVSTNKNVAADVVWSRTKQTLDPATGLLSDKDPVGGGLAPTHPQRRGGGAGEEAGRPGGEEARRRGGAAAPAVEMAWWEG